MEGQGARICLAVCEGLTRALARLEGPGHEQRLACVKLAFKRSRAGSGRVNVSKVLRKVSGPFGLLTLGSGIGASGFILLDAMQQPAKSHQAGLHSDGAGYYRTCRDAFQDGRANILRGEPAYREALDADGDGKACEPYVPITR